MRAPDDVWIMPGTPVRLEGTMDGGELVLADSQTAVEETRRGAVLAAAGEHGSGAGDQTTAVILVGFNTGGAVRPPDADHARAADRRATDAQRVLPEQTYGQVGFSGTVFGPSTSPDPSAPAATRAVDAG